MMSSPEEEVLICGIFNPVLVLFLSAVEWSCLKDFSLLAGDLVLDNLQNLKCTISNLTTVTHRVAQVSWDKVLSDQNQRFLMVFIVFCWFWCFRVGSTTFGCRRTT